MNVHLTRDEREPIKASFNSAQLRIDVEEYIQTHNINQKIFAARINASAGGLGDWLRGKYEIGVQITARVAAACGFDLARYVIGNDAHKVDPPQWFSWEHAVSSVDNIDWTCGAIIEVNGEIVGHVFQCITGFHGWVEYDTRVLNAEIVRGRLYGYVTVEYKRKEKGIS